MGCNRNIYHLLGRPFGECVAILQVVDFDIFDVVAVLCVYISSAIATSRRRFCCCGCCRLAMLTLA